MHLVSTAFHSLSSFLRLLHPPAMDEGNIEAIVAPIFSNPPVLSHILIWKALYDIMDKDINGNTVRGKGTFISYETKDCLNSAHGHFAQGNIRKFLSDINCMRIEEARLDVGRIRPVRAQN